MRVAEGAPADPRRVVYTLTLCTGLALFGDSTIYAVLPSQYQSVGITVLQVGWLLSVNRLVRIPLNGVGSWLTNRWGAKRPYVLGLTLGAVSTTCCGLFRGFWPLLVFRGLWGVGWALLIVAAYALVLQVSAADVRGRYTSFYESYSFFCGAVGALLGGLLTDRLGFHAAFLILGLSTFAAIALALSLPDVPGASAGRSEFTEGAGQGSRLRDMLAALRSLDTRVFLILWLILSHRFFFAGVFSSTLGLHVRTELGAVVSVFGVVVGVASLTAALLFMRNIVTILVVPVAGKMSDSLRDRTVLLMIAEGIGAAGLACLSRGRLLTTIVLGVLLVSAAYFMVPAMLVTWIGDLSLGHGRANLLGAYQTAGDIGSGIAPIVAYGLVARLGLETLYSIAAILLAINVAAIVWVRGRRVAS
jgi:MFS family permease